MAREREMMENWGCFRGPENNENVSSRVFHVEWMEEVTLLTGNYLDPRGQ